MSQYEIFQALHFSGATVYGLTAVFCWASIATAGSLADNHHRVELRGSILCLFGYVH